MIRVQCRVFFYGFQNSEKGKVATPLLMFSLLHFCIYCTVLLMPLFNVLVVQTAILWLEKELYHFRIVVEAYLSGFSFRKGSSTLQGGSPVLVSKSVAYSWSCEHVEGRVA